jgi:hypothetical protein
MQPDERRRVVRTELNRVKAPGPPSSKTATAGEPRTDASLVTMIIGLAGSLILIVIGSFFKNIQL